MSDRLACAAGARVLWFEWMIKDRRSRFRLNRDPKAWGEIFGPRFGFGPTQMANPKAGSLSQGRRKVKVDIVSAPGVLPWLRGCAVPVLRID
jgi:hypothetical protein